MKIRRTTEIASSGVKLLVYGQAGAGKTTLIRGIAEEMGVDDLRMICSPTFSFLNIYPGRIPIYHFDLYRLNSPEEFFRAGFDEYLQADGICCIEWAEKMGPHLPTSSVILTFSYTGTSSREIEIGWTHL